MRINSRTPPDTVSFDLPCLFMREEAGSTTPEDAPELKGTPSLGLKQRHKTAQGYKTSGPTHESHNSTDADTPLSHGNTFTSQRTTQLQQRINPEHRVRKRPLNATRITTTRRNVSSLGSALRYTRLHDNDIEHYDNLRNNDDDDHHTQHLPPQQQHHERINRNFGFYESDLKI